MAPVALVSGLFLVLVGVDGYLGLTGALGDGSASKTALIPAAFGGLLAAAGLFGLAKPAANKHAMHGAAAIGLLGFLGGLVPLVMRATRGQEISLEQPAVVSGVLLTGVCAVFVGLCVNSFVQARKAREKAAS